MLNCTYFPVDDTFCCVSSVIEVNSLNVTLKSLTFFYKLHKILEHNTTITMHDMYTMTQFNNYIKLSEISLVYSTICRMFTLMRIFIMYSLLFAVMFYIRTVFPFNILIKMKNKSF